MFPFVLEGQSLNRREDRPIVEGHARGGGSGPDASQAISNQRKSWGSSFFRLEWLLGPSPVPKAAKVSQSYRVEHNYGYMPPKSNSIDPAHYPRRARVNYTRNTGFVQNSPSRPLKLSRRDEELLIGGWEIGLLFGTSHSVTDIQNNKDIGFSELFSGQTKNLNYGVGAFARYIPANWFSVSGGMKYARFSGTNDAAAEYIYSGYSFTNNIYEFFVKSEFHAPFLEYKPTNIYLFTGVSVFLSDATVNDADGQSYVNADNYDQLHPAMPFGLGLSYTFYNFITVGYEFGWRYTLFHYLDGVRVDDQNYDRYFFNMITVSYPL